MNLCTDSQFSLEAATSRLEDLTVFQSDALKSISNKDDPVSTENTTSSASTPNLPAAGAVPAASPAPASTPAPAPAKAEPLPTPKSVSAYEDYLKEYITPFVTLSSEIGGLVETQAKGLEGALAKTRDFLLVVAESKKPASDSLDLAELYQSVITPLQTAVNIKESKEARTYKLYNHLATVADGASAFSWFTVDTPVSFIGEFKDSAQFFANKILKEFRGVDQKQVDWVQAFIKSLTGLQSYVKEYHTTGPAWNNNGKSLSEVIAATKSESLSSSSPPPPPPPAAAPAPSAGGPPPPPPPPPPPSAADLMRDAPGASASSGSAGMGAVFDELNQGEAITAHLKKVDKSQMTHKNPELRKSSTVQSSSKPVPPKKPAALSNKKEAAPKRPPRKELQDNKWFIENIEGDSSIVIEADISHAIFIDRCVNSTVQIKGKANAVTINSSTGCGVLIDTLVSGVDVIKCKKFGVQVTGKVNTISIDQSDGGQIYLSKESINMEIYTSQSTSLNIEVPKEVNGELDYDEVPVPEQLLHKVGPNGKLVSSIVEHAG